MDGAQFKQIVEYFGEENIISFGFDNSASNTFPYEGLFSMAQNYIDELECLMFTAVDRRGFPYHVVKHVETIQSIVIKDTNVNRDQYDYVSIRG